MKIEGNVIDSNGEPLALATITIQDGTRAKKLGVSADLDGCFYLENQIIEPDSTFMISYIGFVPKLIKATDLQCVEVMLLDSTENADGVMIDGTKPSVKITDKINLKNNFSKQKYVYIGLGALAGIILIIKSIKK